MRHRKLCERCGESLWTHHVRGHLRSARIVCADGKATSTFGQDDMLEMMRALGVAGSWNRRVRIEEYSVLTPLE